MKTSGRQLITMRTVLDEALVAHDFEVLRQDYQPDVLIMAAGNLTAHGCRIVLDDEGSYTENKASGQRLIVEKKTNIYEFMVDIVDVISDQSKHGEATTLLPLQVDESARAACEREPILDNHLGQEQVSTSSTVIMQRRSRHSPPRGRRCWLSRA